MYLIGYFLQAFAAILSMVINIAIIVVVARAILSWVSPDPYNPIVKLIHQISEPMLLPIQRRVPIMGGMDISPIILLFILYFLDIFAVQTINRFAAGLT